MKRYEVFTLSYEGEPPCSSKSDIDLFATFTCNQKIKKVKGFYAGNNRYCIRYLPQELGLVKWRVEGLFVANGEEFCGESLSQEKHGIIRPNGIALQYEDGKDFRPFGTTVYAMMHQTKELINETIDSLLRSPYNKLRTCVFPKHYVFNENEPELFAFEKNEAGEFDFHSPCFAFWEAMEDMIERVAEKNIEVDLILFHPYDKWGFSQMKREQIQLYLTYLVARLAAFPNVWWSMANEYDAMDKLSMEDWYYIEELISSQDPYQHMLSCHYMIQVYDYSRSKITHCSVQGDVTEVENLILQYQKPVLMDEFGYEGNIFCHWGHLSGFELVHRFWLCSVMGGYGTHGETFMHEKDILWWGKGGKLSGTSTPRIAFLKEVIEELPGPLSPVPFRIVSEEKLEGMREGKYLDELTDFTKVLLRIPQDMALNALKNISKDVRIFTGHYKDEVYLAYYGRHCTAVGSMDLPQGAYYKVEQLDVWEMTRATIMERASGKIEFTLPGKEGMAVLVTKMETIQL